MSKEFKKVAAKAGLTRSFHQLRHGVTTLMIAKGIPLKLIQEILGHSTIVITAERRGWAHLLGGRSQCSHSAVVAER